MEVLTQSTASDNPADLITNNIDIWTSAIQTRSTSGRGSSKKPNLYGVQKLRELILELAVRGKLVEQDLNEEPASELLGRIAKKKLQLVKDKKIKKPKPLPEIAEEDNPYTLPQGWEMARLGDIVSIIRGITFPASEKYREPSEGKIACLRTTNVQAEIEWDDLLYVDEKFVKRSEQNAEIGDIVMSMANSRELVGKVAYIASIPTVSATFGGFLSVIRPYEISATFLMAILRTPHVRNVLIGSASQTTNIANISLEKLNPLLVTVPPIAEQYRIVAKVDELMALCDQLEQQTETSIDAHATLVETLLTTLTNSADAAELEQNWNRIADHFDTLFTTDHSIDQLKQTVLQLAVMGKLVPQDPNDEPAAVLLEKIAAEKEQLIKEKKIKKQKPLPPIAEDEKPFSLPAGWEWCRIGNTSLSTEYGLSLKTSKEAPGVPVLKMGNIQSSEVMLGELQTVPESSEGLPELYLENRDLLYNRTNSAELVGKTGIFIGNDGEYSYASYLIRIRTLKESSLPEFLNMNMASPKFRMTQITPHLKQQCGQANVNGTIMKNMLVAVAPEAEQHPIVAKVDQLITLCDQLKLRLQQAQQTQLHLADALVERSIG